MEYFATPGGSRPLRGTSNVSTNFEAANVATSISASSELATEHPAVVPTAGMHTDFMEAYKAHSSSEDVATLVEKHASLCDSYLAKVIEVTESIVYRKDEPAWIEVMACRTLLTEEHLEAHGCPPARPS
ncbi:hypothetical protein MRX96_026752 [Rhipicephalus microplus]